MTQTYKVLAQVLTASNTDTLLYTTPAATSAVISSVSICNQGTAIATFRLSIRVGGAGADNKQYLYYDILMPPNDTFVATIGATLAAGDLLYCRASTAVVSWNVFGSQVT